MKNFQFFVSIFILTVFINVGVSVFAQDITPQSKTYYGGQNYELREGPGFTGKVEGKSLYPAELGDQLKSAIESGNMIEAKRLQDEINSYMPEQNNLPNKEDGPVLRTIENPGAPFTPDWYGTDVTVYTGALSGPPGFRRIAMILGEDNNLYIAVVSPQIAGTSHTYLFRSSNGGASYTQIADAVYNSGYFGQVAITAAKNGDSNSDDSTRITVYYTYSSNSSLDNAILGAFSVRRNGTAGYYTNGIISPSAGNRIAYPSACSDEVYFSTAVYFGVVVQEESNSSGVVSSLRYVQTTTWARTFGAPVTWNTTYDDRYPSMVLHNASTDSVWVAVERRFSSTNYLVRVVASPFSPNSSFNTFFVPPTGSEKYEKPSMSIIQKSSSSTRCDSTIITVIKDGVSLYHLSTDGVNWTTDAILGGSSNGNNKLYTMSSSTHQGTGNAKFMGIWCSNDGDSINIRRGRLGDMGATTYKRNQNTSSTSLSPDCAVYYNGTQYSAFVYPGFGPTNVYANQEALVTGISQNGTSVPDNFSLSQNYPNPFNPVTNIKFNLPKSGTVRLVVFDVMGREVATMINENMNAGSYTADFDASSLSSGIYFYKLITADFTDTKKMMLVK